MFNRKNPSIAQRNSSRDGSNDTTHGRTNRMKSFRTWRNIGLVAVTFMVLQRTRFDPMLTSPYEIDQDFSKDNNNNSRSSTGSDSHDRVRSHDSTSTGKTKRHNKGTLLIFEKVGKTGTTSLKDHLFEVMNVDDGQFWDNPQKWKRKYPRKENAKEVCFRYARHISNETNPELVRKDYKDHLWSDTQVYPPCSCETDVFVSHMTRFPQKMDHFLGRCDLTNVDVLSVIPLRFDKRIDSEIQYGHRKDRLNLDPTKSILDNHMGYKFNPYEEYGHNSMATRTCVFNFLDGTFAMPRSRVTKEDPFECTTKVCEESIEFVKKEEAKHIQQLQERFPVCDVQELHSLLHLPFSDKGTQEEQQRE